jgi:hypothetical protein
MLRFLTFLLVMCAAMPAFPQGGGKAEPHRIEFAPGRTSKVLTGTLSGSQEMDFVFFARKGQRVTVANSRSSLFDVRIFSPENGVDSGFDSARKFSLVLPEDGDYLMFVRKKQMRSPRTAKFSITLTIK